MIEPTTLQDLLVRFVDRLGLSGRARQVCDHLIGCRTEALGGLAGLCERCGAERPRWRSCGDRHCPQCQGHATQAWCERQRADQLPVPYFHLVFTLPHRLDPWVQVHPETLYRVLFRSVWKTLNAFAQDPRRLGGQLGMSAVLHTWGQTLCRHVHLHCLVPGGVLSKEGVWIAVKGSYLFPVRALSRHVRGALVSALREAAEQGELRKIDPGEISPMLDALMSEAWVVYAKPCLAHTDSVVAYLARYTHRIAISNARILGLDGEQVRIAYRDSRDGQNKTLQLQAPELIRRFALHILPKGLMRVRHYGLLANRCRVQRLAQIRELLDAPAPEPEATPDQGKEPKPGWPCPVCRRGRMRPVRRIPPCRRGAGRPSKPLRPAPYR